MLPEKLPYIATPQSLLKAEGGKLVRWRPAGEPDLCVSRELWMPSQLVSQLNEVEWPPCQGETQAKANQRRDDTQATLTSFILGDDFSVGSGNDRSDLKIMNPQAGGDWEAWELRPTRSKPNTRIFGVLASYSDFIAWSCYPKSVLNAKAQTNAANVAVNNIRTVVGNNFLSFKFKPGAAQIGGYEHGWYDE